MIVVIVLKGIQDLILIIIKMSVVYVLVLEHLNIGMMVIMMA